MNQKIPLYILTASLLVLGAYLRSPLVVISSVLLWGLSSAESVLTRQNKDADITAVILRMEAAERRMKTLEADVVNVAERAKTILGEVY